MTRRLFSYFPESCPGMSPKQGCGIREKCGLLAGVRDVRWTWLNLLPCTSLSLASLLELMQIYFQLSLSQFEVQQLNNTTPKQN